MCLRWFIECSVMPLETFFSYIVAASASNHAFLEFLLPLLSRVFFPSHWLLSHITIIETMDSDKRGMNPVAMTPQSSERILAKSEREPATSHSLVLYAVGLDLA